MNTPSSTTLRQQLKDSEQFLQRQQQKLCELFSQVHIITSNTNPFSDSTVVELSSLETSIGRQKEQIDMTEKEVAFIKHLLDKESERQDNISASSSLIDMSFPFPLKLPPFQVSSRIKDFDVEAHLEILEILFESRNIAVNTWTKLFLSTVPHEDVTVLKWVRDNVIDLPWNEAKIKLVKHYQHPFQLKHNMNKFQAIHMEKNESISLYSDRFLMAMRAAKYKSGDRYVIDKYLATIPDYIYRIIIMAAMKESNIHNIIRIVIEIDFSLKRNKELHQMKRISASVDSNALNSTIVKSNTNVSQSRPSSFSVRPKNSSDFIQCSFCQRFGHLESYCFQKKRQQANSSNTSDKLIRYCWIKYKLNETTSFYCFNCGREPYLS